MLTALMMSQALASAPCDGGVLNQNGQSFDVAAAQSRLQSLAWETREPDPAEKLVADCLFDALVRRQLARPSDWRARYALALTQWDFEKAQSLKRANATLFADQHAPHGTQSSTRTGDFSPIWRLDPTSAMLREQTMEHPEQLHLAFFFSPDCNPCNRATKDFAKSPPLSKAMAACGLWVAQMDHGTNVEALRRWSMQQHAAIWAIRDWARYGTVQPRGTPTFLLIRQGHVLAKLVGWPPEGQEAELLQLIRSNDPDGNCR
ncbi:MAG TPA: hypothetical protein VGM81_04515 [Burkholderiaceae bacterium]|jgi:hypothetical protein